MYCYDVLIIKILLCDWWEKVKFDFNFVKNNFDYFFFDGVIVFIGFQGLGKILFVVRYIDNLCKLYFKVILVFNCGLYFLNYYGDVFFYSGIFDLLRFDNGI